MLVEGDNNNRLVEAYILFRQPQLEFTEESEIKGGFEREVIFYA